MSTPENVTGSQPAPVEGAPVMEPHQAQGTVTIRSQAFNSGLFFRLASTACGPDLKPAREYAGVYNVLTTIIFAAMSAEGFINELEDVAKTAATNDPEHATELGAVLSVIESSRGSIRLKYLMALNVLSGRTFDAGRFPFQDFNLLFTLRDELVHLKPKDRITINPDHTIDTSAFPRVVTDLRHRSLLVLPDGGTMGSWLSLISSRAVAFWACQTVSAMVNTILDAIPAGRLSEDATALFRKAFEFPQATP